MFKEPNVRAPSTECPRWNGEQVKSSEEGAALALVSGSETDRLESRGGRGECESHPNIARGEDVVITFPIMRGRRAEHAGRVNNQRVKGVYDSKGKGGRKIQLPF